MSSIYRARRIHIYLFTLLVVCCCFRSLAFCPTFRIPVSNSPARRPSELFSSKQKDKQQKKPTKPEGDDEFDIEHDEEEDDFNWIQGLSRWPLYPPSPKEKEALKEGTSDSERDSRGGFIPIPLANLINVEAILMMNGEETLDSTRELQVFVLNETTTSLGTTNATTTTLSTIQDDNITTSDTSPLAILPDLEELANWEQLLKVGSETAGVIGGTTDALLKEASNRIEYFVTEASTAISPNVVKDLVQRAGRALSSSTVDGGDLVAVATKLAREQGLNVSEAAERARETTEYTTNLVQLANGLLQNGYARGDKVKKEDSDDTTDTDSSNNDALFSDFATAKIVSPTLSKSFVSKAAELGSICGAIYQETIPRTLGLGHSIVANGTTEDVFWMVTDCVATQQDFVDEAQETFRHRQEEKEKSMLVRTITIRGFDASDESIDRELLLNRICTANPEVLDNGVLVHSGLMDIARSIYQDVKPFIDLTAPDHKIVLTGHSVGGSLSILILLLMVEDKGGTYFMMLAMLVCRRQCLFRNSLTGLSHLHFM